ncbi:hypothetical protein CAPTEDRAFT_210380 [Capitella teleta]|uniref:Metallo-beta-lactamase domain-containing protein n=1 Tax=Capitella teleta TaxID=283909 RepID=N1PB51_CAPTE|nr:hypothetical protein CAPTEDRAFT_210380 [Capitella teleta]|eukprot:ELU18902.1 hypothetical protein CAPTEDRAFT_210380 [Capitella teleta]
MLDKNVAVVVSATLVILSVFLCKYQWTEESLDDVLRRVPAPDILQRQTAEFQHPEIIQQVTNESWVAVGFALGNSILLEGPTGLIVVDTTESPAAAAEILQHFRKISSKPIKAIVYTHNHVDHCKGAESFIENPDNPPDIIGHELLAKLVQRQPSFFQKQYRGGVFQFGTQLEDEALVNAGIGPRLRTDGITVPWILPNKVIKGEKQEMNISGLQIQFIHIPGETPDQMGLWLPKQKILLPADDIYRTFPNLYAVRGTTPRDVQTWANSLRKMAALQAEYLIPSHTRPIAGVRQINELFNVYADAIQFIHDQSLRYLNRDVHPDQAAKMIKLPEQLARHPFLLQFYGTVEWSVKAVYSQYQGWFSGDPVELHPLPPKEKATRMVSLVGTSKLIAESKQALYQGDLQWALELVSFVTKADPSNNDALKLRTNVLVELASKETSANGRHNYLTSVLNDHKRLDLHLNPVPQLTVMPMRQVLHLMKFRVKTEAAKVKEMHLVCNFTDVEEVFHLNLRNGLLLVNEIPKGTPLPPNIDIKLTTTSDTWKELVLNKKSGLRAWMFGSVEVDGSVWELSNFMSYFDRRLS